DALVGVEVADPGRDVAGGHDLDGAPRRRPRGPDVAGRLVELEGGDEVDLRLLDRDGPLVAEGLPVDDLALPDPGEVVVDAVAGPARDRLVRVADPDLRVAAGPEVDGHVVGRVRRADRDGVGLRPGDPAEDAVLAPLVREVVVHHLGDPAAAVGADLRHRPVALDALLPDGLRDAEERQEADADAARRHDARVEPAPSPRFHAGDASAGRRGR